MNFSPTDFTYDFSALGQYLTTQDERFSLSYEKLKQLEFTRGQEKIEKACKILNSLTDEQKKAVEFLDGQDITTVLVTKCRDILKTVKTLTYN